MMEAETADFQDWEVLHNSDSDSAEDPVPSFQATDSSSEPLIRSDYFSLNSQLSYSTNISDTAKVIDDISIDWDTPISTDPDKIEEKHELGFLENGKDEVGIDQIEDKVIRESDNSETGGSRVGFSGEGEENSEMGIGGKVELDDGVEVSEEKDVVAVGGVELGGGDEGEKRMVFWWKVPFEVLRCFVFRISPVWTVSMAVAAAMGFVILGQRYYMMKRKSRSMQLKVTVDVNDKKVSQFMSRAARLNEAFSVVKRVPIIRPSLPAAGLTPWPVMTLR